MIVANELRSAFSLWSDRLIALVLFLIILGTLRSALVDRPFIVAASAVAALAAAAGAGAARMVERRLDFHAQDGVLAAEALTDGMRRHYALSIHMAACLAVTLCAAIGRPTAAILVPAGYLAGAGLCHLACRLMSGDASPRRPSPRRTVMRALHRPIAGALMAIPVILLQLVLGSLEPGAMAGLIGLVSALAALLLTMLDDKVVRFMTESGYSAVRIIGIHARSLLTFSVLGVAGSLAVSDGLVAIVMACVALAALLFMVSRILAYRAHSRRTADLIVSLCAGAAGLTAVAMPMLLPVVIIAILWQLCRRSVPATWLLA